MPSSVSEKTKLARKRAATILTLCVIGIGVIAWITLPHGTQLGTKHYLLETVRTVHDRQKGLGGRQSLAKNAGMLFVFDQPGRQCFWMKDMRFAIDIIWTDADKKIIKLAEHIAPTTYPQTFCADTAQYVVELNAGEIRAAQLSRGQVLDL